MQDIISTASGHADGEFQSTTDLNMETDRADESMCEEPYQIPEEGAENTEISEDEDDSLRIDPGSLVDIQRSDTGLDETRTSTAQDIATEEMSQDNDIIPDVEDLRIAHDFIKALQTASLDDEPFDRGVLHRIRHPPEYTCQIDDPDLRLSLRLFLSVGNSSQNTYINVRSDIFDRYPDSELLSYDQVKSRVADMTGVHPLIYDMCPNTCLAYTGPFSDLDTCPMCGESRWDVDQFRVSRGKRKVAQREFHTLPLGPQLQALWRTPDGAEAMQYRTQQTERILEELRHNEGVIKRYEDVYHGHAYLDAVRKGRIAEGDMLLMLSLDGAQLYENKKSDCWLYIWIVLDHAPEVRYKKKHVLVGGIIPGPNKPKNVDSFLFPGFHHLAALQREGLAIWDASRRILRRSNLFFVFGTADTPGIVYLNGLAGHHAAYGCRFYCSVKGRRKPGAPIYYPALLQPDNYDVDGCDHPDIEVYHLPQPSVAEYESNLAYLNGSPNETQYRTRRRDTGISKPSIVQGLRPDFMLYRIPECFPADLMHVGSLNLVELLVGLFRGTIECEKTDNIANWDWAVLRGDVWKRHGQAVSDATPYLPSSFDRPPRNPVEKINSGYKAWEFLIWIYGLAPALLHGVLPEKYWKNFCQLVLAIRLLHQRHISSEQVVQVHKLLLNFEKGFEEIYYQRRPDRIHFCRPCIHTILHLAPDIIQKGPSPYYTQWVLERIIGLLGAEIRQPSNPYANLSQRAARWCQVNALKAMLPDLQPDNEKLPRGAIELENGYVLLRAQDRYSRPVPPLEADAIRKYFLMHHSNEYTIDDLERWYPRVVRWARLRLPNGQIARSAWKEKQKSLERVRMARNVKLNYRGETRFAEVQYYFEANEKKEVLAMISLYSPPDKGLLDSSYSTIIACQYRGNRALEVVNTNQIHSVVAMVPLPLSSRLASGLEHEGAPDNSASSWFFVLEKLGSDIAVLGGGEESMAEE